MAQRMAPRVAGRRAMEKGMTMAKHRRSRGDEPADFTRPASRDGGGAVDPESGELIEPDREARHRLSDEERAVREGAHTPRDPQDDIHLAAEDPRYAERHS